MTEKPYRPSHQCALALAYLRRYGHGPAQVTAAALKYKIAPSTLHRAMRRVEGLEPNKPGQPRKG